MVTRKTKLRTDGSLWQHIRAPGVPYSALTRGIQTDVLIVGGRITGAMLAEALAASGLEVAVVDRRAPTMGSTVASTALVQYEIDTPLLELTKKIGKGDAVRAWRRSRLAVTSLHAFFRERAIDAQPRDSLYLAGNRLGARDLQREGELRRTAGIETQFLPRAQLRERFGIDRSGALIGFDNLTINPRAAAVQLLVRASELGARLYAPVDIVDIAHRRGRVIATSRDGKSITCRHLILASGYEFPEMVPMRGHRITTTWAFATKPQPRKLWPEECLIWESAEPYLYIRTTPDGRVICGGEDAKQRKNDAGERLLDAKVARLQRKLGKLCPGLDTTAEFAWSASFGETSTGLPTIGAVPGHRNCWAALGYGGNGITYSRIAAEVLRAALTGEDDPDADLYAFGG
jgi:glycine/D-amino acid oxidase-like deaminating enzyme